jgi:polyhydroxybutyrate depolymerase
MVIHGSGLSGQVMSDWTGLGMRGPAAGFLTVFPDASKEIWDDAGKGRLDGLDDAGFISGLLDHLISSGLAQQRALFLVGLSNGASFAERLARHGVVTPEGLVLVAGTARELSRRMAPKPARATAVLMLEGTSDPLVPYAGGRVRGPLAWIARGRSSRLLIRADQRDTAASEIVAADWAMSNGASGPPTVEQVSGDFGRVVIERLTWHAPGAYPVILYKIEGGGHGWPGGPQYLPAVLIGRVPRAFDATGVVLDFARATVGAG